MKTESNPPSVWSKSKKCCLFCICRLCYRSLITIITYYSFFSGGVIGPITGPTLQEIAKYLDVSETAVSYIFTVKMVGIMVGCFVMGKTSDLGVNPKNFCVDHQLHKLFFLALTFQAIPMLMIPTIPWLWACLINHFFVGFGWSTMVITSQTMMKILYQQKWWGSVLQGMFLNFGIGGLVYPIFIGIIYYGEYSPQTNLLIIYGVAFVIGIIPIVLICIPPPIERGWKSTDLVTEIDSQITPEDEIDDRNEKLNPQVKSVEDQKSPKKNYDNHDHDQQKRRRRRRNMIQRVLEIDYLRILYVSLGAINSAFILATDVSYQSGLFMYCTKLGWSPSTSSYMNSVYFASYSIGRLFGVVESRMLTNVQMLFVNCIGMTISLTILIAFDTNTYAIFFCTASMAFFNSTCYGSMFVVSECFGIRLSGFEISLLVGIGSLGFFITNMTLVIVESTSRIWFLILNLIYCLILIVLWYGQFIVGSIISHRNKRKIMSSNESQVKS